MTTARPSQASQANQPRFPPLVALFVAVGAASTASIFIRYAQAYAPSLSIAAWRLGLATAVLLPIAWLRHRQDLRRVAPADLGWIALSGALLSIHFATWITSLAYTSVASSVVLVSIAPLFVGLLSPLFLHERPTRRVAFGILMAFAGTLVIAGQDACAGSAAGFACPPLRELFGGPALRGDLLALAGAATVAGYMLIGRRVRARVPLIPYISLTYGCAAVGLILMALIAGQPLAGFPAPAYGWFALLAIGPQLIAHSTYNWTLRWLPAALVSISLLGEPVGSTALAWLLLGEVPAGWTLAGAAVILAGIVLATWRPAQPAPA